MFETRCTCGELLPPVTSGYAHVCRTIPTFKTEQTADLHYYKEAAASMAKEIAALRAEVERLRAELAALKAAPDVRYIRVGRKFVKVVP
jgi:uncharacterized small protein (DUF1192 family)